MLSIPLAPRSRAIAICKCGGSAATSAGGGCSNNSQYRYHGGSMMI